MATLYVFRHGQTEFNYQKVFTGWLDSKLTPLGICQAKNLGLLLKDKKIDLAYQTRLSRSQDTLKEVLKYHPECHQVITDDRMIERGYGQLAGQNHQAIIDRYGQSQFDLWHRGWSACPPEGESFADVEIRVADFLQDIKSQYSGKAFGIALSSHGNSIRLLRKIMENASIEATCSWTIPYDSYFEYQV